MSVLKCLEYLFVPLLVTPQLKELKGIVDEWRGNKKHSAEKMPDSIWDRVFLLIEKTTIPENEVLRSLGIKSDQITNRRKAIGLIKSTPSNKTNRSATIPHENGLKKVLNNLEKTTMTQFEITRPDGLVVKFQAPLSELQSILN
jgi:hypothetical protein